MSRVRRKRHRQEKDVPPARGPVPPEIAESMAAIRRYARPCPPSGKPMRCTPSAAEIEGVATRRSAPGNDGKVIYDSREDAEACAAELIALGAQPKRSYPCTRKSTGGHWHLTTDGHAARRAKNRGCGRGGAS